MQYLIFVYALIYEKMTSCYLDEEHQQSGFSTLTTS